MPCCPRLASEWLCTICCALSHHSHPTPLIFTKARSFDPITRRLSVMQWHTSADSPLLNLNEPIFLIQGDSPNYCCVYWFTTGQLLLLPLLGNRLWFGKRLAPVPARFVLITRVWLKNHKQAITNMDSAQCAVFIRWTRHKFATTPNLDVFLFCFVFLQCGTYLNSLCLCWSSLCLLSVFCKPVLSVVWGHAGSQEEGSKVQTGRITLWFQRLLRCFACCKMVLGSFSRPLNTSL